MINKKYFTLLMIFASLGILSVFNDTEILNFIVSHRISLLNGFMVALTNRITVLLISVFVPVVLFWTQGNMRMTIPLIMSLGISVFLAFALKGVFARPIPETSALASASRYAFPSGHATAVFSVVPIVAKAASRLKWVWISFAFLISFSRLYVGVHYLSDVIFGGLLGIAVGTGLMMWRSDW